MKRNRLIILLILLSSVVPYIFVLGEPYDELHDETGNEYINSALPETISFGNLLPSISGNEIVVGTSKKTLIVMDSHLKTIFSLNLSSKAKKTIIDQIDENLREKLGLFVLTEDGKIQLYEGYGIRTLSLSFPTGLSDFIVMNADEDSQKEIVLINNTDIEAYDLTGEKIWEYQGEHTFKKLIHSKGFVHLGGIFAHTSDRVYLFSYNGGYIFDVEIGNIRGFLSREDKVFVLISNNQIKKLGIENSDLEQIYPNKRNDTNFEYISSIYLAGDEFVVTGQRGEFQILNMNGDIVGKGNLKSEIVGSSYNNLDYDKNFNLPYNSNIRNSEIMIATQEGGIYVYSHIFKRKTDNDIEPQEYYDVNKRIRYAMIFPVLEERPPQRLLIVDLDGRLHSYEIFYFYYYVLDEYKDGVGQCSTERYQESELSLKNIADKKGQNERIDKNREILNYYGLLEDAEVHLNKARKKLDEPKREGEIKIEKGYSYYNSDPPDYEKAIDLLFDAYLKFSEANINGRTEVYGQKTLENLINDIRICIFYLLEKADVFYNEVKFEEAMDYFLIIYPKMEKLMGNPQFWTENREELKPFRNVAKEYDSKEKVEEKIKNCITQLDKLSQDALNNGNFKESRRLNDKLILAASIIGMESEKYKSRNEEIAAKKHTRLKKYMGLTAIIVLAVLFFIFYGKIKKRCNDFKNNALLRYNRAVDKLAHKITETADFKDIFGLDEIFDYWPNFKAYIIIFTFEQKMRDFIRDRLEETYGNKWEKKALSGDKFKEARKRKRKEKDEMRGRDFSGVSLIDYCDLPDLNEAMQKNWDLFKSFFNNRRDDVSVRFIGLYSHRKIIAHSRELSESELRYVLTYTQWFFDRISTNE